MILSHHSEVVPCILLYILVIYTSVHIVGVVSFVVVFATMIYSFPHSKFVVIYVLREVFVMTEFSVLLCEFYYAHCNGHIPLLI